ncbi:MAG: ATP-binding protein [Lachnospiraceae bacterium]|nr:ATP-binding protein [Lachnospiraceae bacterium]
MRNILKTLFVSEEYSYEVQNFNLVQMIYFIGLLLLSGVIYICIPNPIYLYYTILMSFILLVSLIDVNRTGEIKKCAIIVSAVTNFLYLPICFYGFGKLICCVPLYFVLGILYTSVLLNGKTGVTLALIETAYMYLIILHIGKNLPDIYTTPLTIIDYIAIIIGILVVGALSVLVIKTRVRQYDNEYNNMQNTHLKVIDAYNSKDIFFANTSHEIRTPLNAIVGTVNLLLDEELDEQVKDNVYNILNSCNALLSITDELMQLSNADTNDMGLIESEYNFADMLLDIINMMSVRLMESGVRLFVEIDNSVPKIMRGDGGKVRQLFINILNNAVKYTKEGRIIFRIRSEYLDDENIKIYSEVEDTGIGIKEESIDTLFSDYKRDDEDIEKRNIEGTGLGLSLCKELVEKMKGSISVTSKYHVGSTFYFDIVQKTVENSFNIANIKDNSNTATIIYENDKESAEAIKKVLSSLSIKSVIVTDRMEFETSVLSKGFYYVFISAERYLENQRFIDRKLENHRTVIISDISHNIQLNKNCYLITRPIHIINAAMAFNNENSAYSREIIQKGGFTCPNTTILVVDDNLTNLEVASGLLKKYDATIVTAISGNECINTIENMHVDIIFLDYMMPEMNGIDTINAVRALDLENAKTVPVVALTANVVSGAKEMFLEAGFCEYISKPIEVDKLEKTLKTFLPREQLRVKI